MISCWSIFISSHTDAVIFVYFPFRNTCHIFDEGLPRKFWHWKLSDYFLFVYTWKFQSQAVKLTFCRAGILKCLVLCCRVFFPSYPLSSDNATYILILSVACVDNWSLNCGRNNCKFSNVNSTKFNEFFLLSSKITSIQRNNKFCQEVLNHDWLNKIRLQLDKYTWGWI